MKLRLPLLLLNSVLAGFLSSGIAHAININANTTITTNTIWTEDTTIGANNLELTINSGVTVTQQGGGFNIGDHSLTLKGGGTLKLDTAATVLFGSNKTITIDGMTLDLSNPAATLSLAGDSFTRLLLMVKNGGIIKVDKFIYAGSFGGAATNQGFFQLDNGTIQFTNVEDSMWAYGMNILAGGGKVEAMTAGKTVTIADGNVGVNSIVQGAMLTFTGVGNFNTGIATNRLTGAGGIIKDGSGTLTIGVAQNFTGNVELKSGTLVASSVGSLGTNGNLKVTGNSTLEGISAAVSSLSLNAGVAFNVASVDGNAGLTLNGKFELKGPASMTGNLSIGRGNTLRLVSTPSDVPMLTLNGNLSLGGNLLLESDPSIVWVAGSKYNVISATSVSGSLDNAGNLFLLTDVLGGKWEVEGTTLYLSTVTVENATWGGGGNAIWSLGGTAPVSPWANQLVYKNDNRVVFGNVAGDAPQTVAIPGIVAPLYISVNATTTNYVWNGGVGGSLEGNCELNKSGAGSLTINMANNNYSGRVILGGGVIEMGTATALGTGTLFFNGGTLKYGVGVTTDISGRMAAAATGNDNTLRIDTNGNDVVWEASTRAGFAYVKSGGGTLMLKPTSAATYSNSITVNGGALGFDSTAGELTLSGVISGDGAIVKKGVNNLFITSTANLFNGTLNIQTGLAVVGAANTTGGGGDANLGATASIIVENGAAFRTHLGGENKTFTFGNAYVKAGGSLGNIDGSLNYTGNLHFNVNTIGADGTVSYDVAGSSSLFQYFAKNVGINGIISGSGTVNLVSDQADTGKDHRFIFRNAGNTFNGTYVMESDKRTTIELAALDTATGGAAKDAQFKLGHQQAKLVISAESVSIAGLEGTAGTVSAEGGERTLTINQASGDKTFAGTLADIANEATGAKLTLIKDGAGNLTLDQNNTYTGNTTIKNGSIIMGAEKNTALGSGSIFLEGGLLDMNGTAMTNALTISGGNLARSGNYAGVDHSVSISTGVNQGSLNLGGLMAAKVASISTAKAGVLVRGLGAGSLLLGDSSLAVGVNNIFHATGEVYPGGAEHILGLSDSALTVSMNAGASLTLNLTDADLIDAIQASDKQTYQILVTNGLLNMNSVTLQELAGGAFQFLAIDGGNVVISGDASKIYAVASNQQKSISSNAGLDAYNAVLVNGVLNLNLPGVTDVADGLELKNLNGKSAATINVTQNGGAGRASVILNVEDASAVYDGALNGGAADFVKKGAGDQVLGGVAIMQTLSVEEGLLEIKQGGSLSLLGGNSQLSTGTEIKGSGSLTLAGSLTLNGDSKLNGVSLVLNGNNSRLDAGSSNSVLSGLNGSGALNSNNGSITINTVQGQENLFQGRLEGAGALNVAGNGKQSLIGEGNADFDISVGGTSTLLLRGTAAMPGVSYKSLNIQSGSTVIVEAIGSNVSDSNMNLTLASGGSLASGATLAFVINTDYPGVFVSDGAGFIQSEGAFTLSSGSLIDVSSIDPNASLQEGIDNKLSLVLIEGKNGGSVQMNDGVDLKTSGLFDVFYENLTLENTNGNLVLSGSVRGENYFVTAGTTANSSAAADLLWNNRRGLLSTSELGKLMASISEDIKSGDIATASKSMSASVGSTVTSLISSQRAGFRQQQTWIRNRVTQMGVNESLINEDMPYVNAWIQGNGGYSKLDESGDMSGYSLNSWGGTVGADIDLSEKLTIGAAFTADYGSLKAYATDYATGDMDTYYVNLFARLQHKNWGHNLILTGAWTDASLDRTVSYTGGGYTTRGSTSGTSFGAMYEGTYDIALNAKKTSVFQPVFNAGIYSAQMDGYDETGAGNAGLKVGKMDETIGTIAAGGRLMGIVGTNLFGRGALGEVRLMVSQDIGDPSRLASVGYLNKPGVRTNVMGAKIGKTALQLGAGISVPVGVSSAIFADANADIRSGSNSINGSIGYRYNF